MRPSDALNALGLELPPPRPDPGAYVRARQIGSLLFLAGHSPKRDGRYPYLGKVGADVTLEQARECARICLVNALASAAGALGTIDRVLGVVKVTGFIASAPDFTEQPKVLDAASELLAEVFGTQGRHARSAIGVNVLPGDIPVEIELVLEVDA